MNGWKATLTADSADSMIDCIYNVWVYGWWWLFWECLCLCLSFIKLDLEAWNFQTSKIEFRLKINVSN